MNVNSEYSNGDLVILLAAELRTELNRRDAEKCRNQIGIKKDIG
jgi:hypothetical protein